MDPRPIGILDSGVGGLTVLRRIRQELPAEDLLYFGDTARVPYGNRPGAEIEALSLSIAKFFEQFDIKALVIACNTATAFSLDAMKKAYPDKLVLGIINAGVEAALASGVNKLGLIATEATVRSGLYEKKIRQADPDKEVISVACPFLVEYIEKGMKDEARLKQELEAYLLPLHQANVEALVLGCTHFPVLEKEISEFMGDIPLVDPAFETAQRLKRGLRERNLEALDREGTVSYYVSGNSKHFRTIGEKLLERELGPITQVMMKTL